MCAVRFSWAEQAAYIARPGYLSSPLFCPSSPHRHRYGCAFRRLAHPRLPPGGVHHPGGSDLLAWDLHTGQRKDLRVGASFITVSPKITIADGFASFDSALRVPGRIVRPRYFLHRPSTS